MSDGHLIYVVDDEDSIRRSLDFLLSTSGYRVKRWESGDAFLKSADFDEADCILLDIRMPGMDGLQVQQELKARGVDQPVIVLTGHGDVDMAVAAMKAGALDFLQKPFERERLLQSVGNAVRLMADRQARMLQSDWARTQLGKLSDRECQVLDGLACGYPNKTIAYDLGISVRTVEVYRANVMSKLDVPSFADVLRIAFAAGLGSENEWYRTHMQVAGEPGEKERSGS
ncbi:response regulator transcription factor [Alteraurantiacibacter aquimixticola]|uniref:Response regulator transcription factor n=1 Tax=Alteraurantiacibacter aquimixticola TaxID=2489173 RepID=A0A4T3F2W3_9SPHN|nr:response regulator [Alteraurantiacibacter aquimixticola]TIX51543.1 response regulator transcription factor [Alteraurantiacibacter aquimixticola]